MKLKSRVISVKVGNSMWSMEIIDGPDTCEFTRAIKKHIRDVATNKVPYDVAVYCSGKAEY